MDTVVAIDALEHRHLLRQVAREFAREEHDIDDLSQSGWPGLVRACERFNPDKGVPFEACAVTSIRSAIIDWLRKHGGRAIHVPPKQASALLDDPSPTLTPDQRQRREAAARVMKGGMTTDSTLEDGNLGGVISGHRRSFDPTEFRLDLKPRLAELPEPHRVMVARHFGLDDGHEQEPQSTARENGASLQTLALRSIGCPDSRSQPARYPRAMRCIRPYPAVPAQNPRWKKRKLMRWREASRTR